MSTLLEEMKWLSNQGKKCKEELQSVTNLSQAIALYSTLLIESTPIMERLIEAQIHETELLEINLLNEQQLNDQLEIHDIIIQRFPEALKLIGLPPYLENIEPIIH